MKYIWFIVFFAAYVLYLRYLMHMFQLNSYKAAEQNNWMKKNRGVIVLHAAFSVVSFIVLAAAGRAGVIVSAVIWLLALISCWPRKKAKKTAGLHSPGYQDVCHTRCLIPDCYCGIMFFQCGYVCSLYHVPCSSDFNSVC